VLAHRRSGRSAPLLGHGQVASCAAAGVVGAEVLLCRVRRGAETPRNVTGGLPSQDEFDDSMIKGRAPRGRSQRPGSQFLDHPRRLDGASGRRLRLCGASSATAADGGGSAAFLDDRQRAWRHLLHLRGELSTALVSARPGGENVAGCADPPSELKCRMEARRVDRETAESVGGVARRLRRAAALVWVRVDREGRRSPAAVLIIFALLCFGWCRENPGCIPACTESEGDDHYGELSN
jgi:hypothetical protein